VPCQSWPIFRADHVPVRIISPASLSNVQDPRAAFGFRREVCALHVPRKIWPEARDTVHDPLSTGKGCWARAQEAKRTRIKLNTFISKQNDKAMLTAKASAGSARATRTSLIRQPATNAVIKHLNSAAVAHDFLTYNDAELCNRAGPLKSLTGLAD
jgi:hypothetical protein